MSRDETHDSSRLKPPMKDSSWKKAAAMLTKVSHRSAAEGNSTAGRSPSLAMDRTRSRVATGTSMTRNFDVRIFFLGSTSLHHAKAKFETSTGRPTAALSQPSGIRPDSWLMVRILMLIASSLDSGMMGCPTCVRSAAFKSTLRPWSSSTKSLSSFSAIVRNLSTTRCVGSSARSFLVSRGLLRLAMSSCGSAGSSMLSEMFTMSGNLPGCNQQRLSHAISAA
eukprot:scaffold273_cov242-Pinguiococcus_pyrenoidosus.AAC.40